MQKKKDGEEKRRILENAVKIEVGDVQLKDERGLFVPREPWQRFRGQRTEFPAIESASDISRSGAEI